MDLVLPENEYGTAYYHILKEQRDLVELQAQAKAQSRCACQHGKLETCA
jgi:hypothetical protein